MISRGRSLVAVMFVLLLAGMLLLSGCLARKLKPLNPCLVSGVVAEIAVTNIDKVDMLFMVDDSDSMGDKQAALRAQFPHLIQVMTTGMKSDGTMFPPAKDLHLGVVTSDMGLPGVDGIQNCVGLGKDGILQNKPSAAVQGCQTSYPPFLSFMAGSSDPTQTATDFACVAVVGTGGCGYEHQLEAPLKALWPSVDPMPNPDGSNRITFLADPVTGQGLLGHGDVENAGFLRNDPTQGLSLIAIIVLTDEDDCSASDTHPFTPAPYLDPNDPLVMEGPNLRCYYNKQALYPVERYVNGFKALRPGNENLVIYAAITGVPVDLVKPEVISKIDFSDQTQRDSFYAGILADPSMQEVVNTQGTPNPDDDTLQHSCVSDVGKADPPIRVVQVAQKFGENAIVQSICQSDYGPALDTIIAIIAKQLGAVCLPRPLVRNSNGLVGCNVVWELPPPGAAPISTPTMCHQQGFEFLLDPNQGGATTTPNGGAICRVAQLAVKTDPTTMAKQAIPTDTDGTMYSEGWFYDDFSDQVQTSCTGMSKQRVAFTNMAKPPTGVTVKLECLNETQSLANSRTDLAPNIEQPTIGSPCGDTAKLNGQPVMGDMACQVRLAAPSSKWKDGIDHSMFCHPKLNTCVLQCSTDSDCPPAWVCDSRPETLAATKRDGHENGSAICVNPTCGDSSGN